MIVLLTGASAVDKSYLKKEIYKQLNYKKIVYKDFDISYDEEIEQVNSKIVSSTLNLIIKDSEGKIVYRICNEKNNEEVNLILDEDLRSILFLINQREEYLRKKDYFENYVLKPNVDFYLPYIKDDEREEFNVLTSNGTEFDPYYIWSVGFKDSDTSTFTKRLLHKKHIERFLKFTGKGNYEDYIYQDNLKFGTDLWIKIFCDWHQKNSDVYQVFTFPVSEYFINRLVENLGKENVFVINVTRNPSCSYLFDFEIESEDESISNKSHFAKFFSDKNFYHKMCEKGVLNLFNQCVLKNNPNVTTIKYEDLLKKPIINILEKEIKFNKIQTKNNLISQYEFNYILPILKTSKYQTKVSQITLFNKLFSNVHQNINPYFFQDDAKSLFPNNVFQELNYHTISFFDICSSRKY